MIKAAGRTGAGVPLVIIGLTPENFARASGEEPILVDLGEMGLPACQVVIVGGTDDEVIVSKLAARGLLVPPGESRDKP